MLSPSVEVEVGDRRRVEGVDVFRRVDVVAMVTTGAPANSGGERDTQRQRCHVTADDRPRQFSDGKQTVAASGRRQNVIDEDVTFDFVDVVVQLNVGY